MIEKIQVRVNPGASIFEEGVNYYPGQTLWMTRDRFRSMADLVSVVHGVKPVSVKSAVMEQPAPAFVPTATGIPAPQTRAAVPRKK